MVRIEISELEARDIIAAAISEKLGGKNIKREDVLIEVKSKNNYKAEWETASFRAVYSSTWNGL